MTAGVRRSCSRIWKGFDIDPVHGRRQAFLTTDIQALVLGIGKECSCRKMAAGNTTVGSTPFSVLPILGEHDFSEELLQNTVGFKPLKLADQTRANFGSRRIAES
jgi:hypothetical protein